LAILLGFATRDPTYWRYFPSGLDEGFLFWAVPEIVRSAWWRIPCWFWPLMVMSVVGCVLAAIDFRDSGYVNTAKTNRYHVRFVRDIFGALRRSIRYRF